AEVVGIHQPRNLIQHIRLDEHRSHQGALGFIDVWHIDGEIHAATPADSSESFSAALSRASWLIWPQGSRSAKMALKRPVMSPLPPGSSRVAWQAAAIASSRPASPRSIS